MEDSDDDKVKSSIKEFHDSTISKKWDHFLCILEFYSHLFIVGIVSPKNYRKTLAAFIKPKSQNEVQELLSCLKVSGGVLAKKSPSIFRSAVNGLLLAQKNLQLDSHLCNAIQDLQKLMEIGNCTVSPNSTSVWWNFYSIIQWRGNHQKNNFYLSTLIIIHCMEDLCPQAQIYICFSLL